MRTYLALGDSMSIDDYTGIVGGGAVQQFFRTLGDNWTLDDQTFDGCRMSDVPTSGHGDLVTLTVGGNDLLCEAEKYLRQGLRDYALKHAALLTRLREANPKAIIIVGDVYAPALPLGEAQACRLAEANSLIRDNCVRIGAQLAPIHDAFLGRESTLLCLGIEPTLSGAREIAKLFEKAFREANAAKAQTPP
jgi:lysophospholipase L1-like esterase